MREVRASAPGKVNVILRAGAPDADGYHELVTVFECLNVRESVTVRTSKSPGIHIETVAYGADGLRRLRWQILIPPPIWHIEQLAHFKNWLQPVPGLRLLPG